MVLIAATITALSGMTGSLRADVGSWTHHFGMSGLDVAGAAYVPGKTFVTLPGQTPGGTLDAFVPTYDSAGRELWTRQFGTPAGDGDNALAVALHGGGLVVANSTRGTLADHAAGDLDAYVIHLTPSAAP